MEYDMKEFEQDLKVQALCELCPSERQYWATSIALCKKENTIIVQQLCTRCSEMISDAIRVDPNVWEGIVIKDKK